MIVWLHCIPTMIQLNKPKDPFYFPAKTLGSDWSFMLTATSTYGKGAPGAPFPVRAADCFMTRQDWISRPTDGGSKRIYLKRLETTSPSCYACWMQAGRPRFCRMISILVERLAVQMTRTRPPCSNASSTSCIGLQQIWDTWMYKLSSLSRFSAGRLNTSCTSQPWSFLLAACPRNVETSCCNGFQLYDCKTARGHANNSAEDALPLGKTSRRWVFKYGPFRHRRRRLRRRRRWTLSSLHCSYWRHNALWDFSIWRPLLVGMLSTATCMQVNESIRPGPKSGDCTGRRPHPGRYRMLLVPLFMLAHTPGAVGVKVGSSPMGEPGAPLAGAKPHGEFAMTATDAARKRSFRRAVHRATISEDQTTWYRGKRMTLKQLGVSTKPPHNPKHSESDHIMAKPKPYPRLRMVTWNCGGLHDIRYREIVQWLCEEHDQGRPVHILVLQETAWKHDMEFTTSPTYPQGPRWHAIHSSSGSSEGGVMVFILTTLVKSECIRSASLHPGRLLHVRLAMDPPLDILVVYQHAWNVQRKASTDESATQQSTSKTEQLLQRRKTVWKKIGTWIAGTPRRNGCIVLGDFNTPVQSMPSQVGEGLAKPGAHIVQSDHDQLQQLLRTHACVMLNTWSKAGPTARTFLPAGPATAEHGAQIDFIMSRGKIADGIAKQAKALMAKFVPHTGCRHLPVEGFILKPQRPHTPQCPRRMRPQEVRSSLQHSPLARSFETHVDKVLGSIDLPSDSIDQQLLSGWQLCVQRNPVPVLRSAMVQPENADHESSNYIQQMWQIRQALRSTSRPDLLDPRNRLRRILEGWRQAGRLQAVTRHVRKAGRERKIQKVKQVLDSGDIFKTARCLAPKTPKHRIQLRDEHGKLQTHDEEHKQIVAFFQKLYDGPEPLRRRLRRPIHISADEILSAMKRMAPSKARPSDSAPTALWKWMARPISHALRIQFEHFLQEGHLELPSRWNVSELVLLPKPGKYIRSAADLRPISLLPPEMKILSSIIAERIRPQVLAYLSTIPQFAYLEGRTLQQALTRVISHCAEVRTLIKGQAMNIHSKRRGQSQKEIFGGMQLSLDISKAFDCMPRADLCEALQCAQIDSDMITLILGIHDQARVRIQHCGRQAEVQTRQGVLQGSGLSPLLWALYSGFILRDMNGEMVQVRDTCTTYADDFHFAWTIRSARDLDQAYNAVRHVLQVLHRRGLRISSDKTVLVLDIRGRHAKKILRRYVVKTSRGRCMRFQFSDQCFDLKIVSSHVYLGAKISFRKFEMETAQHRMHLARCGFSRLRTILRCQAVPLKLRLQLWRSCILPCLLHALDCTGITDVIAGKVRSLVTQQLRQIARTYSMFTLETNEDLLLRLRIDDPIDLVYKAFHRTFSAQRPEHDRLQVWPSHTQWQSILHGQLFDNSLLASQGAMDVRVGPEQSNRNARLVPVPLVAEQFLCQECGFAFATHAALKSHKYRMHYQEADKQLRQQQIQNHKRKQVTEHASNGMPTCRHCGHEFESWPAFTYHVNSQSCPQIRQFYALQDSGEQLADMQDALTYRDELLEATKHLTWREIADLPLVRQHHHHCLECHHWSASPQYVKRHMKAKRPESWHIVEQVTSHIVQNDFALSSPCRYCGCTFQNRRAHLRTCIGIFNGHYLLKRLSRKPATGQGNVFFGNGALRGDQRAEHGEGPAAQCGDHDSGVLRPDCSPHHGHQRSRRQENAADTAAPGGHRSGQRRPAAKVAPPSKQGQPRQRTLAAWFHVERLVQLEGQERGQDFQAGHEQAATAGRHAHDTGLETRASTDDQSARHQLYHFPSDRYSAERGSEHIRCGSEMERGQNSQSRQPQTPAPRDPLSAPFDHGVPGPGIPHGGPSEDGARRKAGLDQGWQFHGHEVGPGKEGPQSGRHYSPGPHPRSPVAPLRGHQAVHRAFCHQSLPCDETVGFGIRQPTAEANRLWSIFNNLARTSVWITVGAYCRHERLQRSALANRLAQSSNN